MPNTLNNRSPTITKKVSTPTATVLANRAALTRAAVESVGVMAKIPGTAAAIGSIMTNSEVGTARDIFCFDEVHFLQLRHCP